MSTLFPGPEPIAARPLFLALGPLLLAGYPGYTGRGRAQPRMTAQARMRSAAGRAPPRK
jgi:hypothetical protein